MIESWIVMLIMDLIVPIAMIGFGKMFVNRPPKNINDLFGYRTAMSMKNRDTWEFAHRYCGKLWFRFGLVLLVISVPLLLLVFGKDIDTIGAVGLAICSIQLILMFMTIFLTENALKKVFDKNGRRKDKNSV